MSNKTTPKTVRLSPKVLSRIEELSKKENRTFANMVDTILMKYIESEVKA